MSEADALELDDDSTRKFADMDAHTAQVALAEELMTSTEREDEQEASSEDAPVTEPVDAAAESEVAFIEPVEVEWSDEDFVAQLRMVEALFFAAAEPLDIRTIADRLPAGAPVDALIEAVREAYAERGVNLQKAGSKWRFVTAPDVAHVLEKEQVAPRKLSRAALETLAIIAYHQPCTRADIEDVRGVAVSKGSLDQLLEIGWVKLRGKRRDVPGRPTLYGTTSDFLEHFALEGISDLPGLADLKAAGLLDARLPPGFSVPTPADAADGEDDEDEVEGNDEFVQDFHELDEEPATSSPDED